MTARLSLALGLALSLWALAAQAQTPDGEPMRLIGQAPGAPDSAPKAFVVDALVTPGDSDAQTSIEGWLAATEAPATSGEVTGTCVETHCTMTADLDGTKFALTGDFGGAAGPAAAKFTVKDSDDTVTASGAATLAPLTGPIPGLGPLADPAAITEAQLDDLLVWAHESVSSGSPPGDGPPTSDQRDSLAAWQNEKGRLATGLIFAADLAELTAERAAAQKAGGWTTLGDPDHGWSAGYPAALLPKASGAGAEHRFASADGKAVLVIAIDAPMTSDQFDAFVEKISADRPGRDDVNTTQANGDVEMRYVEAGTVTVAAYHNRDGGLARLVYRYPAKDGDAYQAYDDILQRALVAGDGLKR